ncbi:hypothetical protein [Candidatus Alkanophaga liquidiphilum]
MKLRIFLCTCYRTLGVIHKDVKRDLAEAEGGEIIEVHDALCLEDGLDTSLGDIKRFELDAVIIGACTEKRRSFELATHGISTCLVNLREHCGWVHDKKEATEKAKSMLKAAVIQSQCSSLPETLIPDVGEDVLVISDEEVARIKARKRPPRD